MTAADISRRAALAAFAAAAAVPALAQPRRPAIPPLSAEDKQLVDKAVAYLQTLNQVKGRFVQVDARGRQTQGDLFLKRPGKMRFAYDKPSSLLVVSDGGRVNVYDSKLKTFESYPLGMTPLGIFLAKEIRLDRGVVVSAVRRFADGFSLTARDGRKETEGEITLVFGDSPMSLREWTVRDPQGQTTRVMLRNLQPVASLDPGLFRLNDPRVRGTAKG